LRDAIQVQGLRLAFGTRVLLDSFDWVVPLGARCTVIGPSGCGKSTLLKCLLGFEQPSVGSIEILGSLVTPVSVWDLRRRITWVPQEPEFGDGTPRDYLGRIFSYRANRGLPDPITRVAELTREFQLSGGILDQPIDRLSGGEKQRIAIISALLLERPLVLLDEPFSAIDAGVRRCVAEAIARTKATVVSASHEPLGLNAEERVIALRSPGGRL